MAGDILIMKEKKQLIKNSKFKILFLSEKKRGVVFARNKYLKKIKCFLPKNVLKIK